MIDWYTKAVLTVIAICLVVLVVRGSQIIPEAWATGEGVVKVQIVGISNRLHHNLGWQSIPVSAADGGAIPIMGYDGLTVPVKIVE